MAIRWIKNVVVDGKKSSFEVQIGDKFIGDKAYTRVNKETEKWFKNVSDVRDEIILQGIEIIKSQHKNKKVTLPNGSPYNWTI